MYEDEPFLDRPERFGFVFWSLILGSWSVLYVNSHEDPHLPRLLHVVLRAGLPLAGSAAATACLLLARRWYRRRRD